MLEKKYKNIVLIIGLTIVATIAVQFYWNVKIYEINKQQLNNQIQVSLDKAIDDFYNEIAKQDVHSLFKTDSTFSGDRKIIIKNLSLSKDSSWALEEGININHVFTEKTFESLEKQEVDTIKKEWKIGAGINPIFIKKFNSSQSENFEIFGNESMDSLAIKELTTKIMFSFQEKLVDLNKIDSLLNNDLTKKNININYGFVFTLKNLTTNNTEIVEHNAKSFNNNYHTTIASSSFLPHQSQFKMIYITSTLEVLSTMIGSIVLSLLLSTIIIACLIFLLQIIFKQKQLSAIKNDFISNITHEFKTPIATIAVALEGFEKFDVLKDDKKRNQYLSMSNEQLGKLNGMVEKLLDTASMKADQFEINLELVNLSSLINKIIDKYEFCDLEKSIKLSIQENIKLKLDPFHFENALNNIVDNAIKHGGNEINISINSQKGFVEINIEDNGNGIDEKYKSKIFDQFYRIPSGDIHNVKGFGIGLYYTKNIVEKHGGRVFVSENKKGKVNFKIKLPYEY